MPPQRANHQGRRRHRDRHSRPRRGPHRERRLDGHRSNGGNAGTSVVDTLAVNGTSQLDLNNNDLIVHATAATKNTVHAEIEAEIVSAQNGLDSNLVTKWNGPGHH